MRNTKKRTPWLYPIILGCLFLGIGTLAQIFPYNDKNLFGQSSAVSQSFYSDSTSTIKEPVPPVSEYIEVVRGCELHFTSDCTVAYTQPDAHAPSAAKLRIGTVLEVTEVIPSAEHLWYKIEFKEWVRYPERTQTPWYVQAEDVRAFENIGTQELSPEATIATSTKRIVIDRSDQTLYAYENDELFMEEPISTGLEYTPTPRGTFFIYKKTPSRYMQGPLPNITTQYYDLPGVPWNLYFSKEGAVIHGAYWHDEFGKPWSHGCVNLSPQKAERLYNWAVIGTPVLVRD